MNEWLKNVNMSWNENVCGCMEEAEVIPILKKWEGPEAERKLLASKFDVGVCESA